MGRRLNTYVHIDGTAYGPDSDVPDEVAERITAPGVWDDQAEEPDPAPHDRPSDRASKAAWVEFAVAQGVDPDEAEALNRDELAAKFPKPE